MIGVIKIRIEKFDGSLDTEVSIIRYPFLRRPWSQKTLEKAQNRVFRELRKTIPGIKILKAEFYDDIRDTWLEFDENGFITTIPEDQPYYLPPLPI